MMTQLGTKFLKGRKALYRSAAVIAFAVGAVSAAQPAFAQQAAAQKTFEFDLPAQALARSVSQIASISGMQVLFDGTDATEIRVPAIKGKMTAEQALSRLLAGSGLTYQYVRPGVITLRRLSAEGNASGDGEYVTGVVSVEGFQGSPYFGGAGQMAGVNGVNGSRDITATEGTGSFTSGALTIGSKVPQAMKDVPQSISVLTSERMAQQNVTDFTTAMRQLPGVTLAQGNTTLENTFYSRGFAITSIQIDGGAPLSTSYGFYPQIDMSIYDHVELLRGAAGQFGSYGQPGGSVNLVRKKPLDHAQFSVEAQAGSWSNYRIVADATSPLALDGKLRGRLVMTYQDNRYFYDTAKDNKTLIYGISELDISPTTLLSAGISYSRQDSVPWQGGLQRYQTGGDLELPRSTSFAFPWNRWDFDTTEIFGAAEQKIGEDWTAKLNLTYNRQASTLKVGNGYGAVNPTNGLGPQLYGSYVDYASKQFSAEATLSGAFSLFGQRQEVTIGVNRVTTDGGGQTAYASLIDIYGGPYQPYPGGPVYCADFGAGFCPAGSIASNPPVNVFDFDPTDPLYSEPANPLPNFRFPEYGQTQAGAYINLRLTAFDRLHVTTGLRWSQYAYENVSQALCTIIPVVDPGYTSCFGLQIGDPYYTSTQRYKADDISWPPPVNVSFDVTKSITAYVGFTDIYQSQASYLTDDQTPMAPLTGSNWEAGIKWGASDGKLNLSLSAYSIKRRGFARIDPDYPPYQEVSPGVYCCFIEEPDTMEQSKGLDFEASGEISKGWQLSASYTYSENKRENGTIFGGANGRPFASIQPKHLYKLWMSYDFWAAGETGVLSGLTLSGGVNGQSSAFYSGSTCVNLDPNVAPDPVTGYQPCNSFGPPDYVDYAFTVPAYAVFSARVDYRFSSVWSLAVNLDNIFDKTYYQTVGQDPGGYNWYGAPRSVTATLRAKW